MTYLLFAGDDYYPCGGGDDFIGCFDSIDEAIFAHDPNVFYLAGGWANIFCVESLSIVKRFKRGTWKDG